MQKITFEAHANELPAGGSSVMVRSTFSPVNVEAERLISPRDGDFIRVDWNRHTPIGGRGELSDFILEGDIESMREMVQVVSRTLAAFDAHEQRRKA